MQGTGSLAGSGAVSGQFECGRVLLASKTSVQDEAGESSVLIGRSISLVDRSVDSGGLIFEHIFSFKRIWKGL